MNWLSGEGKDAIQKKMSEYKSFEELSKSILYHGTCEDISGKLRGGGYDNMLWTANRPDIAQTYIPESGATITYYPPKTEYDKNNRVRMYYSDGLEIEIMKMMGYEINIEADNFRKIQSYSIKKDGEYFETPTNSMLWDFLQKELKYEMFDYQEYIKLKIGQGSQILPADYKMPGELYVMFGAENLNLYDISTGESDLLDLQYHKLELFEKLINGDILDNDGNQYDGIIIDDFAQTERYGNLGHESFGLTPSGIKKLEYFKINATNHDWDEEKYSLRDASKSKITDDINPKQWYEQIIISPIINKCVKNMNKLSKEYEFLGKFNENSDIIKKN